MHRLWCFPSRLRADTGFVRIPCPLGGRTHLERTPREMIALIVLGAGLAAAALIGVSWAAGFGAVTDRLRHCDARWLPLALGAEVLAYLGYVLAYREVARVNGGPTLPHSRAFALVATGVCAVASANDISDSRFGCICISAASLARSPPSGVILLVSRLSMPAFE